TSVQVTMNSAVNCYCQPVYTTGTANGDYISNVQLNGSPNLSNPTVGASAPYYTFYNTPNPALDPGSTYSLTVTTGSASNNYVAAWIDYNLNGLFEASELLDQSTVLGAFQDFQISFTVPLSAVPGANRLRIREASGITSIDPCLQYNLGETEDYAVTFTQLAACSGAPAVGTVTTAQNPVIVNANFILDLSGLAPASAYSYQWQASANNVSWSDISGATSVPLTTSQAANTYYRVVVRCDSSGISVASNSLLVLTNNYCVPVYTSGTSSGDFITQVRIEDYTGNSVLTQSSGATTVSPYYKDYTVLAANPNINAGSFFWLRVTPSTWTDLMAVHAWIDWNSDGDFDDAGEQVTNTSGVVTQTGHTFYGSGAPVGNIYVNVPSLSTAILAGEKRVRVRYQDLVSDPGTATACGTLTHGETEDYNITLIAPICSTPSAAPDVVSYTPTYTTVNDRVTLTLGGTPIGGLKRFDWTTNLTSFPAGQQILQHGFATSTTPSFVDNINEPFIFVRAVYQNQGCPEAYTSPIIVT
ncbi:MAG TPA: GEVED domain-containing protein, partial [Hymenobacter sp.]|nr:GEVED domain-containing protein [Hymenobacter sp.]